ncbi:hypothetical protein [Deminuibacter soli]
MVVITGASSGMGEATARKLVQQGAAQSELGHDITSPKVKALYGNLTNMPKMDEEAIAYAVIYGISQPGNINVNEIVLRPPGQTR